MSEKEECGIDRRSDVGPKIAAGVITAVLTTIFLGSLGLSIRANELNQIQEVRIAKVEVFLVNQDRLNAKLEKIVDEIRFADFRGAQGLQGIQGLQGEKGERR